MKKTYVVSFVNPDPSLEGNALFGWTETLSLGELKRERGGGATAFIAVIIPSSIHDSDLSPARQKMKDKQRQGKRRTVALHDAEEFHHDLRFEDGRMRTWRFPRRSALTMLFCKILRSEKRDIVDEIPLARQSFYVCEEA
jgi:hypothetical protein